MKDSEELIEKVLTGLRNAEPSPGMERRILVAVQDAASTRSRPGWRRFIPIWLATEAPLGATRPVAFGAILAGIIVFALAVPMMHRREHVAAPSKENSAPLKALPTASSELAAENAISQKPRSNVRPMTKGKQRRTELASVDDSLAMREMRAPSRPAPTLPLTEQEKLLLRMVHTRPEELALLDPVKWAAKDAKEKAEFEKFFGSSTNRRSE